MQQNQGGQVKALLQSPAKTPQTQQVIVKQQGTSTPVLQKITPAGAVMVSGGQIISGQQQVVVSGNQVINAGGQQVSESHSSTFQTFSLFLLIVVDRQSNSGQQSDFSTATSNGKSASCHNKWPTSVDSTDRKQSSSSCSSTNTKHYLFHAVTKHTSNYTTTCKSSKTAPS